MTEPTPGPWTVRHRCVDKSPYDDESCGLGLEVDGPPEPQLRGRFARAADAHLVAAAPELLAALDETVTRLKRCLVHAGSDPEFAHEATRDARAAIAKARGEEQA